MSLFDPAQHPRGRDGRFSVRHRAAEADVDPGPPIAHADGNDWPAHQSKDVGWQQRYRSGNRADRTLREVTVSLPPFIADLTPTNRDPALVVAMEEANRAVTALDHVHGADLAALGTMLLRTESVASSKIENISADIDDYARALQGVKANPSATSMVAATEALDVLIRSVDDGGPITLGAVCRAHHTLMADDVTERSYAGRIRDVQNWIGGSDHSPRGALYVPPPADTVSDYMDDLLAFANRDDIPVLVQAAVVHAQFESVHPFTDGNGRIGRALINAVLRRRASTRRVVVPLASALVAHRDRYFDLLGEYRQGHVWPILAEFSHATMVAAQESTSTAGALASMPERWRAQVGQMRKGSAVARLFSQLADNPVFTAEDAHDIVGGPLSSVYTAIDRFREAEVIRPLTDRKRNQIFGVSDVLDELDDLGARIGSRAQH